MSLPVTATQLPSSEIPWVTGGYYDIWHEAVWYLENGKQVYPHETVQLIDENRTIIRGAMGTVAYNWPDGYTIQLIGEPWEQGGTGHELTCPNCGYEWDDDRI